MMSRQVKRAIGILIFSEFLIFLGHSMVIPVTPFLKNELHFTALDMGTMTALFAFAQFIASPIIGRISDRVGRKPILVAGLSLFMVSEFVFALTNRLAMFDLSRLIGGLSAAMVGPTAMAMAADITSKRDRAKVIGWLSAAFSGGLILGPGIGGLLAQISYKTPFWVAAALGLISTIFLFILLPSEQQLGVETSESGEDKQSGDWHDLLTRPVIILFILILTSAFGLAGFESVYSLYVNEVFNFTLANIALVLVLNGVGSLILQVIFFDRLVQMLGERRLIRYCVALTFAGTIWNLVAHTKIEVILATLVVFCAIDILRPAITTLLTKASDRNQGLINGLNMSLTSVGNIIGPLMSGALLDINHQYPYMVVAGFMAVSYLITFGLKPSAKQKTA